MMARLSSMALQARQIYKISTILPQKGFLQAPSALSELFFEQPKPQMAKKINRGWGPKEVNSFF
jgi:hypothetical protein